MNHKQFIESIGRTGEVAALLGVDSQSVSKWKSRGIPWPLRSKFVKLAAVHNVPVPDGFLDE